MTRAAARVRADRRGAARDHRQSIDPRNPARGLLLSLADRADAQVGQLGQRVADWYEVLFDLALT